MIYDYLLIPLDLHKGETVQVVYSTSTGWSKIKFKNGYVNSKYLTKSNLEKPPTPKPDLSTETVTIMKCNASTLNLRSGPSTSYSILGRLRIGEKVKVIEQLSSVWSKIKFEGKVAYVSSQYLSKEVSTKPPTESINYMKCIADI